LAQGGHGRVEVTGSRPASGAGWSEAYGEKGIKAERRRIRSSVAREEIETHVVIEARRIRASLGKKPDRRAALGWRHSQDGAANGQSEDGEEKSHAPPSFQT
jgi:hypothetical protein